MPLKTTSTKLSFLERKKTRKKKQKTLEKVLKKWHFFKLQLFFHATFFSLVDLGSFAMRTLFANELFADIILRKGLVFSGEYINNEKGESRGNVPRDKKKIKKRRKIERQRKREDREKREARTKI